MFCRSRNNQPQQTMAEIHRGLVGVICQLHQERDLCRNQNRKFPSPVGATYSAPTELEYSLGVPVLQRFRAYGAAFILDTSCLSPKFVACVTPHETFSTLLRGPAPVLALAPMQDVTTLEFWRVLARYGGADAYWTEYFRVHGDSRPEKRILDSITKNPTGKPVVAQLIGNNVPALIRTAKELQHTSSARTSNGATRASSAAAGSSPPTARAICSNRCSCTSTSTKVRTTSGPCRSTGASTHRS